MSALPYGFDGLSPDADETWPLQTSRELIEETAKDWRAGHGYKAAPSYSVAPVAISDPARVELIKGSTIAPQPINWLWPGWLAAGKCHVFGGAPGAGKTTIAGDFAATVSIGGLWPDGTRADAGNVVVWSGEDDPHDTLAPRLIAAGADMDRVFFVGDVQEAGKSRAFDPAKDIGPLRAAITGAGGASLLIVDPLVSAIAGDSHKNAEVRRALQPLVDLAAGEGAALVGVTHFSKGTAGREPTERITGSLAFGALARIVLIAAKTPGESEDDPPSRIFMRAKSNIGPDDGGFQYDLRQVDLEAYPGLSASRVEWGERIEGTAREVLQEAESSSGEQYGAGVAAARDFLRALLADGSMAANRVEAEATGSGLSMASLRRAKKALGVIVRREGFGRGGEWLWSLPDR